MVYSLILVWSPRDSFQKNSMTMEWWHKSCHVLINNLPNWMFKNWRFTVFCSNPCKSKNNWSKYFYLAKLTMAVQVYSNVFVQYLNCTWKEYWCLSLTFWKHSHRKVSMTNTCFSVCGSFMYLLFLAKICLSGTQLTMNSASKILWTSEIFTFHSLPIVLETSNGLVPISLTTLKLGTYFASQFDFLPNLLIILKSPIINWGMLSYMPYFVYNVLLWY